MGLDIYLYKYDNFDQYKQLEKEHSEFSIQAWIHGDKKYEQMTDAEKKSSRTKVERWEKSHGFIKGEYGNEQPGREKIEFDSEKYPKHMFKIGYFRSSYNGAGINPILENLGLPNLAKIWGCTDEYTFRPDWAKTRKNLVEVLTKLNKIIEDGLDLRCSEFSPNMFGQDYVASAAEAIEIVKKKLIEHRNEKASPFGGGSFSNMQGEFHLKENLEVIAMIHGKGTFNRPCVFVITKGDTKWYAEAIEVMIETCDYALAHKDEAEQFYLRWSG